MNNKSKSRRAIASLPASLAALLLCTGAATVLPTIAQVRTGQTPIAAATNNVLYVNPQLGRDTNAGTSEAAAYRTITYALQKAQTGTVIQLAAGTYSKDTGESFPLPAKSGVTLRGNSSNKGQGVLIIGGGTYLSRTFASQNVTVNAANNSIIEGVTITNPNASGTGLWIESTNAVVRNSTFKNSRRDGIFVTGNASPKIENNVFIENEANGISIAREAGGEVRGNIFQNTGFGLAIGGTSSVLVIGNTISQNVDGMVISNSATPVLRENAIEGNERDGIVVISSARPDLGTVSSEGQNRIRNNGRHALYSVSSELIQAVGNDIDRDRIIGSINFVPADVQIAFQDVEGHWAQAYISALTKKGIIAGFPDGTFKPNEPVTRAQFAAIVAKAFAPSAQRQGMAFRDVTSSFWGADAISMAYRGGFLAGYPEGVFRPNQEIPKVQAIVALVSGLGLRSNDTASLSRYNDAAQIPDYALTAVAGATENQLVVNYPQIGQFDPNREATRAEVAAFVYQALVNAGKAEAIPSPYLVATP
jgi:parallel beta-helix repeat protein